MLKNILHFLLITFIFSLFLWFLTYWGPNIKVWNWVMWFDYIKLLFIPTIIFLILLYLAEKSNSEKVKMRYAIASVVLAVVSWIWFFVYNNYFL